MRNSVSEDYFSFMSERGKSKTSVARPAAVVPAPAAPSTSKMPGIKAESCMEVTESCISDTMIQQMFKPRHGDKATAVLDK